MTTYNDQTKLINVSTGEYPVTVAQLRRRHKEWFMGQEVPEYVILDTGYAVVRETDKPNGDVVTEGTPSGNVTDGYFQTWEVRPFTPEEVAARLQVSKEAAYVIVRDVTNNSREFGAPYTISEGNVQHVQLREKDISNLTGLGLKAQRDPNRAYHFRSRENIVNEMTAPAVVALTDFAFDEYEILLGKSWGLEATIAAAETEADIPTEEQIKERLHFA